MSTELSCTDDLPFTARDAAGGRLDWHPRRVAHSHEAAMQRGRDYAAALAVLAGVDEYEAWAAAKAALLAREWNGQCSEEDGFADGLARAAVVGWRAMAQGEGLPFDTSFEPTSAQWFSLNRRVELMEAQLKSLKRKPWRSYADAGQE
jgi:hypothetical protein